VPGVGVPLERPHAGPAADLDAAAGGKLEQVTVETLAREAEAAGGQARRDSRATDEEPGAAHRDRAEAGRRHAEMRKRGRRSRADELATHGRTRDGLAFAEHDPQPARHKSRCGRSAGRTAADDQCIGDLHHRGLIRPTA
jgi:hypothetical protein